MMVMTPMPDPIEKGEASQGRPLATLPTGCKSTGNLSFEGPKVHYGGRPRQQSTEAGSRNPRSAGLQSCRQ